MSESKEHMLAPCGAPYLAWGDAAGLRPCDVGKLASGGTAPMSEFVAVLASVPPQFLGCALNEIAAAAQKQRP